MQLTSKSWEGCKLLLSVFENDGKIPNCKQLLVAMMKKGMRAEKEMHRQQK